MQLEEETAASPSLSSRGGGQPQEDHGFLGEQTLGTMIYELEVEDREAFTNFLRVPSELFWELKQRLMKQDLGWWNRTCDSAKLWNLN